MGKTKTKDVSEMEDEEVLNALSDLITSDIMNFVEIVIQKRVSLFIQEIHDNLKGKSAFGNRNAIGISGLFIMRILLFGLYSINWQ